MSKELLEVSSEKSLIYAQQALLIAERLNYRQGIGDAIFYIASAYIELNNYSKSLEYYLRALKFYQSYNTPGQAAALAAIGRIYFKFGDFQQALDYYWQAIELRREIEDMVGLATSLTDIGILYTASENYDKAVENFQKAIALTEKQDNLTLRGDIFLYLGDTYEKSGELGMANTYYQKAISVMKQNRDQKGEAKVYQGLGDVKKNIESYNEALAYYLQALSIQKQINDQEGISYSYLGIADLYIETDNAQRALDYLDQSQEIAQKLGQKQLIRDNYQKKAIALEQLGQHQEALDNYRIYKAYNDSLYNESRLALITEMQTRFELATKERENKEQRQKIQILTEQHVEQDMSLRDKERNIQQQNLIILSFIGITLLTILLIVVLYRGRMKSIRANRQLQAQNLEINRQKAEIEKQSKQLEEAFMKISDSIHYAETIQKSILPSEDKLRKLLREYFVISEAKEVVSGDFYWISKIEDKIFIAVVDCTGHGVPGGFTSMIGHTLLNEIINQKQVYDPSRILELLNQGVINVIEKQMQDIAIGMEACLALIEPLKEDPKHVRITYAGAKRPLFSIRNNGVPIHQQEVTELRGDREPIGFVLKSDRRYTNKTLVVEKGSIIYLTSDGFVDQANERNKRFGTNRFKALIRENAAMSLPEQKQKFVSVLQAYKKSTSQRDDITVVGLRL